MVREKIEELFTATPGELESSRLGYWCFFWWSLCLISGTLLLYLRGGYPFLSWGLMSSGEYLSLLAGSTIVWSSIYLYYTRLKEISLPHASKKLRLRRPISKSEHMRLIVSILVGIGSGLGLLVVTMDVIRGAGISGGVAGAVGIIVFLSVSFVVMLEIGKALGLGRPYGSTVLGTLPPARLYGVL